MSICKCNECGESRIYPGINAEGYQIWYCENCGHEQEVTNIKLL